tara:strand:- start:317 stop:580 length:264 start_codon:yes stop_codon:yes gene_type:complete
MANRKIANRVLYKGYNVSETTYIEIPEQHPDDRWVVTTMGDRLDLLAKQYYGNQHLWYFIAKVNGINTVTVDAGIKLRLPKTIPGLK